MRDEERKLINVLPSGCTFLVRLGRILELLKLAWSRLVFVSVSAFFLAFVVSVFFFSVLVSFVFFLVAEFGEPARREERAQNCLHSPFYNGECRVLVKPLNTCKRNVLKMEGVSRVFGKYLNDSGPAGYR